MTLEPMTNEMSRETKDYVEANPASLFHRLPLLQVRGEELRSGRSEFRDADGVIGALSQKLSTRAGKCLKM